MKKIFSVFLVLIFAFSILPISQISTQASQISDFKYDIYYGKVRITGYVGQDADVVIPAKLGGYQVTIIKAKAFYGQSKISSVKMPEGMETVGTASFAGCINLTKIEFPNSLQYIDDNSFEGCEKLVLMNLPLSLKKIGYWAFYGCQSLKCVSIPPNVSEIGCDAFEGCDQLQYFIVDSGNPKFSASDGILYDKTGTIFKKFPEGKTTVECKISTKVTKIGASAFAHSENLTDIEIPDSVKDIEPFAFSNCPALISIVIPNSVTQLGDAALHNCTDLITATLPKDLKYLGADVFANCINLTTVKLPDSLLEIPDYCFEGCASLLATAIPKNVTKIGEFAFAGCQEFTSVIIPKTVKSIEKGAFDNCYSMQSISVETGNLYYAGLDGILYDKGIKTLIKCPPGKQQIVSIPSTVNELMDSAFENCEKITGILIPAKLYYIDKNSFEGCSSLINFNVAAENPCYSSVNGVMFNKSRNTLFNFPMGRSGQYVVPKNVIIIDSAAFRDCRKLTQVTLPDSLATIEEEAFADCMALRSVTIPKNVTFIKTDAFANCGSLEKATFIGNAPTLTMKQTWSGKIGPFSNCTENFAVFYTYGCKGFSSKWCGYKTNATLPKPVITLKKISSSIIQISWSKFKYATEYRIYAKETKNGHFSSLGTVSGGVARVGGAKKNKTYYFKVRSVRNVKGQAKIYSDYSVVKSIKM